MRQRWRAVLSLAIAAFVDAGETLALSILWPRMYLRLGASLGQLGAVLGLSELVRILFIPIWGYAVDRYSRKRLMVFFTGLWGLWTLAIGLVDTLPQLYIVRSLSAIGLGVFNPAAFSLAGDLFSPKERGRAVGVTAGITFAGTLAAFIVLPRLADQGPEAWRMGFVVMGLASVLSGVLIYVLIDEPPRGAAEPELEAVVNGGGQIKKSYGLTRSQLNTLLRIPSWRWLLIHETVFWIGMNLLRAWIFVWLDGLGLGTAAAAVFAAQLFGSMGFTLLYGWLGDRLDHDGQRRASLLIGLAGLIASVPTTILFFSLDGSRIPLMILAGVLFVATRRAVGESVTWPLAQGVIAPELRGTARAIMNLVRDGVGAATLAASGLLVDRIGTPAMLLTVFTAASIFNILVWLPLLRVYPRDRDTLHTLLTQQREALLQTER